MSKLTPQQLESLEAEMDRLDCFDTYMELIGNGQSPRMAAMLAARQAPRTKGTDSEFNRHQRRQMADMDDENREAILSIAKRAGIDTTGKTYNGQLGKYDDPLAWVGDTGDVVKAAKEKKYDIKGDVNVNYAQTDDHAAELKRPKPVPEDIVQRTTKESLARDPELQKRASKSPEETAKITEEVRERITPTGRPLREDKKKDT